MMAAILNSAILDSDIIMLDSDTFLSSLRFTQKHSPSTLTLTQTNSIWFKLIHFSLNLMMAAILNSAMLNMAILDSGILVYPLKLTHTCQDWFPPFAQKKPSLTFPPHHLYKKTFIHSLSLNLMMVTILNSAVLNSIILDSGVLVFPLKLTHTCQDWFPTFAQKIIHSFILTQLDECGHLEFCHLGIRHCHLGFRHLVIFSQIHSKTLSLHSESDSN